MSVSLKVLKNSLSECHVTKNDVHVKMLQDVNNDYLLNRAIEAIGQLKLRADIEANTRLVITLINLFRVRENGTLQSQRKSEDGAGSCNTGSDHK